MATKGERTRERILGITEPMVLQRGFVGTSIDDILKATGLTKGAFFNHFASKAELARALVERYAHNDYALFEGFADSARVQTGDPLEETMVFLRLFEEFLETLDEPLPGCVFAAYTYESQQFDPSIADFIDESFRRWSALYEDRFAAILAVRTPRMPATAQGLAEMMMAIIEGGLILSRVYRDPVFIARQSRQFRQYLELLFEAD